MIQSKNNFNHDYRHRLIASILVIERLAYISYGYREYEYVGDPLNILSILSGFNVDEVLIVDISASARRAIDVGLLRCLRSVADFPLTYAGGLGSLSNAQCVMELGYDKLMLSLCNKELSSILPTLSSMYGEQALALSIDYGFTYGKRYLFNPYSRELTNILISYSLIEVHASMVSDLVLSCVDIAGKKIGLDRKILQETFLTKLDNPLVLAGGLEDLHKEDLEQLSDYNSNFAGIAASSSIFLQSGRGSALVCLRRHIL